MQIPKTLWLKNHMPADRFAQCQFFDLPDFCTHGNLIGILDLFS